MVQQAIRKMWRKKTPDMGPLKKVKNPPEVGPVGTEDELDSKSRLALNLL